MAVAAQATQGTDDFHLDPTRRVSVGEVLRVIPEQWIVMAVTGYNERDEPVEGFVVSHGRDRKQVVRRAPNIVNELPPGALGVFYFFSNRASVPHSLVAT